MVPLTVFSDTFFIPIFCWGNLWVWSYHCAQGSANKYLRMEIYIVQSLIVFRKSFLTLIMTCSIHLEKRTHPRCRHTHTGQWLNHLESKPKVVLLKPSLITLFSSPVIFTQSSRSCSLHFITNSMYHFFLPPTLQHGFRRRWRAFTLRPSSCRFVNRFQQPV